MENVINKISYWVHALPKEFSSMSEIEISKRPLPNKWSKKEILGHLCDSAINNLQRFINIQYEQPVFELHSYNQDQWVTLQNYQNRPVDEISALFQNLNKQIISAIENLPEEKLMTPCNIGNNQLRTFEWLINDYLEHMEHHIINQILKQ